MNNKITAKHTFKSILYLLIFLSLALTACLDDSAVSYNEYSISSITTPVDDLSSKAASSDKKVYIGHSLPVNVELTAKYDEDDIPIQFYLLNVDDVNDVDDGIAFIEDMRMYYCYQSSLTTIDHIEEGTNKYGLVINVPADQSKDEFTGDFKVGTYYVVAEVDKNQRSEINPYIIYTKYKDILDESNTISIATDYMKKPDLSVEGLFFTGEQDYPNDVVTFYNLDLSELPGAENAGLELMYIKPSIADRTFSGTVHVRSSSSDALNVPISFYLESEDGEVTVPLEIYDRSMEGYVEDYYIKILRKNTTERISLRLRIPDDIGNLDYFSESNYDNWESETQKEDYPLSALRHKIDKEDYGDHTFKIKAVVNEDGSVKETRFIIPNSDNSEYNEDDFIEDGNENGASTLANNTKTENLILSLEKIDVEPNEGVVFYPYSKLDPPDPDYKNLVIFWLGLGENIGDDLFGGILEVHGGMFFRNYSFFSMGYEATLHISKYEMGAQLYLNAESHPFDGDESFYDF